MAEQYGERPPPSPRQRPSGRPADRPPGIAGLPVWAIVLGAIVVAFLIWLIFIQGDDDNSDGASTTAQARKTVHLTSATGLPAEAADADYPVYWLGPKSGVNYEITLITDGRTYVRYLPAGVESESADPYLTVGSYSQPNAFDVLKRLGQKPGASTESVPNGGLALVNKGGTTGVYVAYPGVDTQIEIFDPDPGRALDFAKSGDLAQVG